MTADELKARTKRFALDVIRFVDSLPQGRSFEVIGRQLLRAGTSVGSNYRAACRGRSRAEFTAKLGIVEEEADESIYWLELLAEIAPQLTPTIHGLTHEANEILSITIASIRTTRRNR